MNRRFTALFAWLAHFGAFVPQQRGIDREHLVVMVQLVIDEFPDGRVKPRVLGEWERVVNRTGVEKVGVVGGGSPEGIAAAGYVPLTDEHIAAMLTGGLTLHHKKTWRAVQLSFSNGGVQSKNTEAVMTDIHFPSAFVLRRDDMGRPDWLHGRTWHIAFEARCREKGGTYTAIMTVQSGWSGADAARTFCVYDSECDCTLGSCKVADIRIKDNEGAQPVRETVMSLLCVAVDDDVWAAVARAAAARAAAMGPTIGSPIGSMLAL